MRFWKSITTFRTSARKISTESARTHTCSQTHTHTNTHKHTQTHKHRGSQVYKYIQQLRLTLYQYVQPDNNYPLPPCKITFMQVYELILLHLCRYTNNTLGVGTLIPRPLILSGSLVTGHWSVTYEQHNSLLYEDIFMKLFSIVLSFT